MIRNYYLNLAALGKRNPKLQSSKHQPRITINDQHLFFQQLRKVNFLLCF